MILVCSFCDLGGKIRPHFTSIQSRNGSFIYLARFIPRELNVLNIKGKNIKTCVRLLSLKAIKTGEQTLQRSKVQRAHTSTQVHTQLLRTVLLMQRRL